jgi:hypothetical protein
MMLIAFDYNAALLYATAVQQNQPQNILDNILSTADNTNSYLSRLI